MNIMNIEGVVKGFGNRTLLDGVSFGVNQGDKIGVIGLNGMGKSTLLKIIAGIETPDEGKVVMGNGVKVAYLPQNPQFDKGETIIEYVCKNVSDEEVNNVTSDAKTILTKLGINNFEQKTDYLSGGQKKRVALARTILHPFDIIILDEPTNHLDSDMVMWLENFLIRYKGQVIMVTHDRYFLDKVTNRIIEIDKGKLYAYQTNFSGYIEAKAQREELAISTEHKRQNILRTELAWIRRGCQARSTKQQARIDRFEELRNASKAARADAIKKNLEMSSISTRIGRKTIEINNVTKQYNGKTIINNFSHIVLRDERIGIVGPNGCGKSTLIKIITKRLEADSGNVEIGDTIKIGCFMQENEIKDETERVIDYVKGIGEYVTTVDGKITASQMCEKFLFTPTMQYTPIEKLSGGEKRRLYLLSVLMESPNVLVLDEPTNDLDIETLEVLENYLDNFNGMVITVSHDRYFLDRVVERIFAFEKDGTLTQYEGGFTDYYDKLQLKLSESAGNENENNNSNKSSGAKYVKQREAKLKFTYLEQKEFETIDDDIARLEEEIEKLDKEIAKEATNYGKLNELSKEKEKVEKQLEEKMDRWVYLNDLAEKIEASKK